MANPPHPPSSATVVLAGVHRSFGSVHAVRGIDLIVNAGECVALLGPNGAGKTTTLELVVGLLDPDVGTVTVCGTDARSAAASGCVGAMLQFGVPIQLLRVRELVAMVASLYPRPRDVGQVLAVAGLTDIAHRTTAGLSGGQAQRVRFACALVTGAEFLVLDEPTVALDVDARRAFWSTVRRVVDEGTTVVFATHLLEEADANADRVVVIARGTVVADATPNEIRARAGSRRIRATLMAAELDRLDVFARRDGHAMAIQRRGPTVEIVTADSDRVLRALLAECPGAHDVEVVSSGLEEAFVQLTSSSAAAGAADSNTIGGLR